MNDINFLSAQVLKELEKLNYSAARTLNFQQAFRNIRKWFNKNAKTFTAMNLWGNMLIPSRNSWMKVMIGVGSIQKNAAIVSGVICFSSKPCPSVKPYPYIYTDDELKRLFRAIDGFPPDSHSPSHAGIHCPCLIQNDVLLRNASTGTGFYKERGF